VNKTWETAGERDLATDIKKKDVMEHRMITGGGKEARVWLQGLEIKNLPDLKKNPTSRGEYRDKKKVPTLEHSGKKKKV